MYVKGYISSIFEQKIKKSVLVLEHSFFSSRKEEKLMKLKIVDKSKFILGVTILIYFGVLVTSTLQMMMRGEW